MTAEAPSPTLHASLQFIIRSQQLWPTLRTALREAVPVDDCDLGHQVRYHEETETLLVARYGVIRTVLRLELESETIQRAAKQARGGSA